MKSIGLLGCKVREKTTGYSGVVTSIAHDLVGCIQAFVTPAAAHKNQEGRWYDIQRLEVGKRVMPSPKFAELGEVAAGRGATAKTAPTARPA